MTTLAETKTPLENLRFVRIKHPDVIRSIPEALIESVKGRTFSVEQFYTFQEMQAHSPYNFLYAIVDYSNKIHGYLWVERSMLDGTLFVNTFSISRDYWGKGKAVQLAIDYVNSMREVLEAKRVFWISTNDKFYIKKGFKRSKNVLMEYNQEKTE